MKRNKSNRKFKIACVMVTYNNATSIVDTINSVFFQTYPLEEIIVVDNASPDGTARIIEKNYPNITLFANEYNTGIGKGCAIGMEYAYEKKYDWIWLLDGDSKPESDALEELIKAYSHETVQYGKIGILASSPVNRLTGSRYNCAMWRDRLVQISIPEDVTDPFFVDIVISSGSLINSKVIDEIGFPRADFFIDFVDTEYNIRMMKNNYKIALVPTSIIFHEIGDTKIVRDITRFGAKSPSYIHSPWRLYYMVRNQLYTCSHELQDYKAIFFFSLSIIKMIFAILIYNHDRKIQRFKYIFLGIKDGLKGRLGKVYGPE